MKKLSDAHGIHLKRHQRREEEERVKRRAAPFAIAKKESKSRLPKVGLSTDAAWKTREGVLRYYTDSYTAIDAVMKALAEKGEPDVKKC